MENITKEQLDQYRKILNLDPIENLDTIIQKYINALIYYYYYYEEICNDIYDISHLELIISSFQYFASSSYQISEKTIANICNNEQLLLHQKDNKKSQYDILHFLYLSIVTGFIKNLSPVEARKFLFEFEVFKNFSITLGFVYEYEEQEEKIKKDLI